MLLIPYLLQKHDVWKMTYTRLFVVVTPDTDAKELQGILEGMMTTSGMVARVKVIRMHAKDAPRYMGATLGENPNVLRGKQFTDIQEKVAQMSPESGMDIMKQESFDANLADVEAGEEKEKSEDESVLDQIEKDEHGSKLTGLMKHYSRRSELVVLTMPKRQQGQEAKAWLTSVEELSTACKRVIFVHETGHEKIQFSSE